MYKLDFIYGPPPQYNPNPANPKIKELVGIEIIPNTTERQILICKTIFYYVGGKDMKIIALWVEKEATVVDLTYYVFCPV